MYIEYEELYKAYIDCLKHKKHAPNASTFFINENINLYRLYKDLNSGTYEIGKSIAFTIDWPKWREVFAADFRDRIVQHLLINRLNPYIEQELTDRAFSCRVNKGTLCGINKLYEDAKELSENFTKEIWVYKGDFKSYFMSIDKRILYNKVLNIINKYNIFTENYDFWIDITKKIIFNCPQDNCIIKGNISLWINHINKSKTLFSKDEFHGLPVGNVSSQVFSNVYMNDFDKYVIETLGYKYYGRYCDDFYILANTKEELLNIIPKLKNYLNNINITLHPNKVYIQPISKGCQFIGGIVKPNRTYVINRTKGRFYHLINKTSKYIDIYGSLSFNDLIHFFGSVNSYLGIMQHANTYNIRKKILSINKYKWLSNYIYTTDKYKKLLLYKELKV